MIAEAGVPSFWTVSGGWGSTVLRDEVAEAEVAEGVEEAKVEADDEAGEDAEDSDAGAITGRRGGDGARAPGGSKTPGGFLLVPLPPPQDNPSPLAPSYHRPAGQYGARCAREHYRVLYGPLEVRDRHGCSSRRSEPCVLVCVCV